jgi:hypothetical protein
LAYVDDGSVAKVAPVEAVNQVGHTAIRPLSDVYHKALENPVELAVSGDVLIHGKIGVSRSVERGLVGRRAERPSLVGRDHGRDGGEVDLGRPYSAVAQAFVFHQSSRCG